ncbi:hypothetical protein GC170_07580 [bacterium]|nr:hypothetical protein [bacterium]
MRVPRWFWTGIAGGLVGMAIWLAIGYFTMTEVGYVAWGVGFIVGAGVRYGAFSEDTDESFLQGAFAALTALVSIIAAKLLLFSIILAGLQPPEMPELINKITSDDAMIVPIADSVVGEMSEQGKKLKWPKGSNLETAEKEADYPPGVWKEAKNRWDSLGEPLREAAREERRQAHRQMVNSLMPSFSEAFSPEMIFSPHDLLWFGLAAVTAFRIGVGTYGRDD